MLRTTRSGVAVVRHGISSGDVSLAYRARQAVHGKATGRLTAAIKSGDHLAVHVDHLAARIDAEPGAGVVDHRSRPCRIKRWLGNLVERLWLAEVGILAGIDE